MVVEDGQHCAWDRRDLLEGWIGLRSVPRTLAEVVLLSFKRLARLRFLEFKNVPKSVA